MTLNFLISYNIFIYSLFFHFILSFHLLISYLHHSTLFMCKGCNLNHVIILLGEVLVEARLRRGITPDGWTRRSRRHHPGQSSPTRPYCGASRGYKSSEEEEWLPMLCRALRPGWRRAAGYQALSFLFPFFL